MVQIVPTILTNDISEVKEKLKKLQGVVKWVHFDIMDGQFVNNKTVQVCNLVGLKLLEKFKVGLHLMVKEPIKLVGQAEKIGAKKVIAQIEMMSSQKKFVERVIKGKMKPGLALDLETNINKIDKRVLPKLETILLMTVKAGWGGQKFNQERLKEIKELRNWKLRKGFRFKICVDGGVNEITVKDCLRAGADILAVGSFLWKAKDIKETIKRLKM